MTAYTYFISSLNNWNNNGENDQNSNRIEYELQKSSFLMRYVSRRINIFHQLEKNMTQVRCLIGNR